MEVISPASNHKFRFNGEGGTYFGIVFINWVFTVLSLGLYYPWAKAKKLHYLHGETELADSRFSFTGTGAEMFKGFIKAVLMFGALYAIYFGAILSKKPAIIFTGLFIFLIGFMILIPIAIHGSLRYRMAKTEYRGISFSYTGDLKTLVKLYWKGIFFSIITLGIYGSWFQVTIQKYTAEHIKWGDNSLGFSGEGSDLFVTNLVGSILTIFTIYIYSFWYIRNLHQFYINNLYVQQGDYRYAIHTNITAGDCFKIAMFYLLGLFTLGIMIPFASIYEMRVMLENIEIDGNLNLNNSNRSENATNDATGEDLADMLDLDLTL